MVLIRGRTPGVHTHARATRRHVETGDLPPVSIFVSLEGFTMRLWPGGHEVLRRDARGLRQTATLPIPDTDVFVPPGCCVVLRFDVPHAGGTSTNVRLCTVVGSRDFPRPALGDGSAYVDNVNFHDVERGNHKLFRNAEPRSAAAAPIGSSPAALEVGLTVLQQ